MSYSSENNGNNSRKQRPMYDQYAGTERKAEPPKGAGHRPAPPRRASVPYKRGDAQQSREVAVEQNRSQPRPVSPAQKKRRGASKNKRRWPIVLASTLTVISLLVVLGYSLIVILTSFMSGKNTDAGVLPDEIGTLPEYSGKGIINFLVCGLDYDDVNSYSDKNDKVGNTDMILYVHYDTVQGKASILQLPRDTFVGTAVNTGGTGKINGLYTNAEDTKNRMAALANVVYDQLHLPVDFYVTIDMDAVKEIIDILPSKTLRVYVPMEVSDPDHPEAVIPEGWREFTSAETEFFLRNRKSPTYQQQGDIMRMQMQQSFYSAIYREFKDLSPTDLLMWMKVLLYRINTNMDALEMGGLAQKALSLQAENITFIRPPCGQSFYGDNSLISLDAVETADLLNEYFRPEGEIVPVSELNIQELPREQGTVPANIRTMGDIRSTEPEE